MVLLCSLTLKQVVVLENKFAEHVKARLTLPGKREVSIHIPAGWFKR
jgi:hypothetical protein